MAPGYFYKEVLPFSAMVGVECAGMGLYTLFKAAASRGLSYYVFVAYSYAIATLVLLPFPFILRRTAGLPTFKLSLLYKIFLLGVIGVLAQLCGFKGIQYSSPTLASAIGNLSPAFTFVLAVIFRMEKLAFRSSITQAKIMGTLVSISGALVVVLYKGPILIPATSKSPFLSVDSPLGSSETNWVIGALLVSAEYLLISVWYIVQTQIIKEYPAEFNVVFVYNLCAAIIAAPVCFLAEGNVNAWRLRPDITLAAVIYSGLVGSSSSALVHTWGLHFKGPVYVSTFKPLSIAIAAAMGVILLGDALPLGSVVGAVIISIGFYAVVWAKAKEGKLSEDSSLGNLESPSDVKAPLLENHKVEGV